MGLFKKLLGGDSDPLAEVRKALAKQQPRPYAYDYDRLAADYVFVYRMKEADAATQAKVQSDPALQKTMVADYAKRLQGMVDGAVTDEVSRLQKTDEFNRVRDAGDIDANKYLSLTIPTYSDFLDAAVRTAVVKLGGPSLRKYH